MTDHLSRQPFIDMLKTIVQSQRGNPAGYSLAIDGEWGCGKTWVLDALEEQLSADGGSPYLIFRYNAWENDFYDEPLAAILSVMIGRLEDISKTDAAISEINAKLFATAAMLLKNIAVSIANTTLKNKTGLDFEDVVSDLKSVKDATAKQKKLKKEIEGLLPLRKGIDGIRAEIKKLSDTFSVILIVDELDRCLPEYAIKVLERLHHVCNGMKIIQIIAIDKSKIAFSICKVFGRTAQNDADQFADLYLKKFIDVTVPLNAGVISEDDLLLSEIKRGYEPYIRENWQLPLCIDDKFLCSFVATMMKGVDRRMQEKIFSTVTMCHKLAVDSGAVIEHCTYAILMYEILSCIKMYVFGLSSPYILAENSTKDSFYLDFSAKNCSGKYKLFARNLEDFFKLKINEYVHNGDDLNNFYIRDEKSYLLRFFIESAKQPYNTMQECILSWIYEDKKFLSKYDEIMKTLTIG